MPTHTVQPPTLDHPPIDEQARHDGPVPELLPGHPGMIVTRGYLPHRAAYYWHEETHTLVVAPFLSMAGVLNAVAEVLGVAA